MKKVFDALFLFSIFAAVAVLLSQWIGLVYLNSAAILIVSAVIAFFLFKRFSFEFVIPKKVLLLSFIVFLMCIYPLLLLTPFYPPSSDSYPVITIKVLELNQKIPATYAPFSDISFHYPLGFPLFAKIFTELFFFFPDYLVVWFFGALFAAFQLIFFYFFAFVLTKNESVAEWAALLFLGSRVVFQNMYFGLAPWIFAAALMFLFLALFLKKNKLSFLFFPAIFVIHSGTAFNLLVFLVLLAVFFREQLKNFLMHLPSLVLAIPCILTSYLVIALLWLFESPIEGANPLKEFFSSLFILPFWVGLIPFILFLVALIYSIYKKAFDKTKYFLLAVIVLVSLYYGYTAISGGELFGILVELVSVAMILFAAISIVEFSFFKKFSWQPKLLVLVLCLIVFFSSGYLNSLRFGERISADEAEFALAFKNFDPELETALILSNGNTKIAEFSNKIPFNAMRYQFIPYDEKQNFQDNAYAELLQKNVLWEKIVKEECIECINELNVKYVVINKVFFKKSLPQKPVFEFKQFQVFELKE